MTQLREPIDVLGLGAMGSGMAASLLRGGFDVVGYGLRPDATRLLVERGGRAGATPAEVGSEVATLVIAVRDAGQVDDVLFGAGGAAASLAAGSRCRCSRWRRRPATATSTTPPSSRSTSSWPAFACSGGRVGRFGPMSASDAASPTEHPQTRFQAPPGATEVLLVRHGQSAAFRPGQPFPLVDGHGDPALSPLGRAQAEAVGTRLRAETVHAIYVTKLQRTAQTAAPLAAHLGLVPVVDPDLHEVFLGEWEGGLLRQKAAELDPIYLEVQARQDWGMIPGAESFDVLRARCVRGIERICGAHPDERVVVVVHGGVIAALCAHATGSNRFAFAGADNASIHHFVVDGSAWTLRCFNDTAHLGGFTTRAEALT